jgi:heat shock protein HslJ
MRNKNRVTVLAGIAALALLLAGCAGGAGSALTQDDLRGQWGSLEQGEPNLEFDGDGQVSGTDGCNRLNAGYTIDGDRVQIEMFAMTAMACEGIDEWLGQASEATISGDTMSLLDKSGEEIGQLQREK